MGKIIHTPSAYYQTTYQSFRIALIQDALRVAGREETLLYRASLDGGDWEPIRRMDARGNVGYRKVELGRQQREKDHLYPK
jgi:hypothetical protein